MRTKLALEPMRVSATARSALLKVPLVASAGLSRLSRSQGDAELRNEGGLFKQGNFILRNIQVGNDHFAKSVFVHQRGLRR